MEPGCPFCKLDPYHYVDTGVGYARVAVVCCDRGIGLIQHNDPKMVALLDRINRIKQSKRIRRRLAERRPTLSHGGE